MDSLDSHACTNNRLKISCFLTRGTRLNEIYCVKLLQGICIKFIMSMNVRKKRKINSKKLKKNGSRILI